MRVAVTGSHGYIGRNLVSALRVRGDDVTCFDLKIGCSYLSLLYEDVPQFDAILHLAAFSHVGESHKTHELLSANVIDLATLMTGLRGYKGTFVFVSSSAVYALDESGPYGLSKALGESIVRAALPEAVVVRPFNVIGGRIPDDTKNDHLIPKLFAASRNDTAFQLYGSGDELRSYVHVDQMVNALVDSMTSPRPGAVDVVGDMAVSVKGVISLFQERWPLRVVRKSARRDNPSVIRCTGFARAYRSSTVESIQRAFDDYAVETYGAMEVCPGDGSKEIG